jgi:hypothetical protein
VTRDPTRPFGGRCETAIAFLSPLPGDPPNLLRLHIDYVCQLQHLGRTISSAEQIVIFTSPTTTTASNTTTPRRLAQRGAARCVSRTKSDEYGYMPISRKMPDGHDPIWQNPEPFDVRSAWLDLLFYARFAPGKAEGEHS